MKADEIETRETMQIETGETMQIVTGALFGAFRVGDSSIVLDRSQMLEVANFIRNNLL